MTVFSNLQSAKRFGFQWFDDDQQLKLHIVVRDVQGKDGMRRRELALARPDEMETRET